MTSSILGYTRTGAPIPLIRGAEGGYSTQGDIVTQTIDGQPINAIWAEFQETLQVQNNARTAITNLLAFGTVRPSDAIAQTIGDDDFERATEFGEPTSIRATGKHLVLGYDFHDYDKATRFTWRFIRDATAEQVISVHDRALYADNQLTTSTILRRLLNPTPGMNTPSPGSDSDGRTVYGLWNGDDIAPPRYLFQDFPAPHNHYMTSLSATLEGKDLDDLIQNVSEHGYLDNPSAQALLIVNPAQMGAVARVRTTDATEPNYDFVPSVGAPSWIATENILNPQAQAPANFQGMKIAGSYGPAYVTESGFMPPGYVLLVATGGPNSTLNPIGFRQHPNTAYQGLRLIPGAQSGYPLIDAFYSRGFGVGTRHRGAAAVLQVTTNAAYTPPTL